MKLIKATPYLIAVASGYNVDLSSVETDTETVTYNENDKVTVDTNPATKAWVMQNFEKYLHCSNGVNMRSRSEKFTRDDSMEMFDWYMFVDPIYLELKYDMSFMEMFNRIPAWPTIMQDFFADAWTPIDTFVNAVSDHGIIMFSWKPDDIKEHYSLRRSWFTEENDEEKWHWYTQVIDKLKVFSVCAFPEYFGAEYAVLPFKPANPLTQDKKLCKIQSDRKKCELFKACYFSETYKDATGEQWEEACPGICDSFLGDKSEASIENFLFKDSDRENNKSDVCKGLRFVPKRGDSYSYPKVCNKKDCVDVKPAGYAYQDEPADGAVGIAALAPAQLNPIGGVSFDNTNQPELDPYQFLMKYKYVNDVGLTDGSWTMLNTHPLLDCEDRVEKWVWEEYQAMTNPTTKWDFSATYQPYSDNTNYKTFMDSDISRKDRKEMMDRGVWDWISMEEFYGNFSEFTKNMYASLTEDERNFYLSRNDWYKEENKEAQEYIFMYNRFMVYRYCVARPLYDAMTKNQAVAMQ